MTMRYYFNLICAALAAFFVIGLETDFALAAYIPPAAIPTCTAGGPTPCTDYFGVANYANSPLPSGSISSITVTSAGSGYTSAPTVVITDALGVPSTGASAVATVSGGIVTGITILTAGAGYTAPQVALTGGGGTGAAATAAIGGVITGGMRKFVDALPGLCGNTPPTPGIQQCLPVAVPDTTTFPGSDYYVVGLQDTSLQMHSDLPATKIRGYVQLNAPGGSPAAVQQYLGPLIVAQKDRPVRMLFENLLGTGNSGDLFEPVDTTYMGAGMGPDRMNFYTQNRATVHLHGGRTPWISDGTPHQWITPPGDTSATFPKGASFQNVPDMVGIGKPIPIPGPSDGLATYFYTNQQSGRLLFYHDHAYGTTRQDVYAGEAAGYLIVDPVEETALNTGTSPGAIRNPGNLTDTVNNDLVHLIPLVIQDQTFVPPTAQLNATDPTWDSTHFGGLGSLWFPHVYMTNQDPADPKNMNAFGRWDYGPWFFPPQTSLTAGPLTIPCVSAAHPGITVQCPIIPNPSGTPESFMDTPVVNGVAYPVLHVAPAAYRFQILSVGNDRTWNLSWFIADATGTEVPFLPAVTPASTLMPLCTQITQITNPGINGLAIGALDSTGMPLNGTGLPSNCWPSTWPLTSGAGGTAGLTGIVPDPRNAGPAWIQIGTEGGPLPAPVVIPPTPVLYETNPKSITVGSVGSHGLLLGPAERADVIVDFSKFGGKTLILYNDGPAPIPGYDIRYDYFTGDTDLTSTGGAPPTLGGYGPNTRTVMQVVVDQNVPNATPFSLSALNQVFASTATTTGVYQTVQPSPIVPESIYNTAFNQPYTDTFMKLQDDYMSYINFDGTLPGVTVTAGGSGYTTAPMVTFTGGGCTTAPAATATVSGGVVTGVTLSSAGAGCTSVPTVAINGVGTGATAIVGGYIERKTIQELFTADYGRMNATLGTELPLTNFLTQTTIPLGYIDPPTEIFKDGETQLWRVTHNGVDTHLIHFHLFDVQIINRVGWDGTVRPPDPNEVGWKDTVRMNPLEDIIVALRPAKMTFPFQIPDSVRDLDTTMPEGTTAQFTGVNPFTNAPMTVTNQPVNFGWEYVWHCHILGHEENDMMRPMVFEVPPEAPTNLAAPAPQPQNAATLTWTNNAVSATSFTIQRALDPAFTTGITTLVYGTPSMVAPPFPQGLTTYTDTTVSPATTYYYRVAATKTFPARQSPTWAVPPQTEDISSPWTGSVSVSSAGVLNVSPVSASFGSVPVGFTSLPVAFTILNTGFGSQSITVNSITVGGTDSAMFPTSNGTCGTLPLTLGPGSSCVFSTNFVPTTAGNRTATITVASTDPVAPSQVLSLAGSGVAATASPVERTVPAPMFPYTTLTSAFTSATGSETLEAWGIEFTEPSVTVNSTGTVTFGGGYDTTYTTAAGVTGLKGVLTIKTGILVVGNLTIM